MYDECETAQPQAADSRMEAMREFVEVDNALGQARRALGDLGKKIAKLSMARDQARGRVLDFVDPQEKAVPVEDYFR